MEPFTLGMTIVLCGAGLLTAISILNIFSHTIGHETQLHDLRNHVKELHFHHAVYLARINGQISGEIFELPPEEPNLQFATDTNSQITSEEDGSVSAQILQQSGDAVEPAVAA